MNEPKVWDEKALHQLARRIRSGREMLRTIPGMPAEMQRRLFLLVMDCEDCRYEAEMNALRKGRRGDEH
jgi:hypothetical protein